MHDTERVPLHPGDRFELPVTREAWEAGHIPLTGAFRQAHDYVPDFVIRLRADPPLLLILETKGFDPTAQVKVAAAERWVSAVNVDRRSGRWAYAIARRVGDIQGILESFSRQVG